MSKTIDAMKSAKEFIDTVCRCSNDPGLVATAHRKLTIMREAIVREEAQTVEPVAYRYRFSEDLQWQYTENKEQAHRLAIVEPIYISPQQAVPTHS